jgi:transcription elongation GreA/GreB family factor
MATGTQNNQQQLGELLLELARGAQIEQVSEKWMAQLAAVPTAPAFFKDWLKAMKKANATDQALELIVLLLEDRCDQGKAKPALRVLLTVLPSFPTADVLRPILKKVLQAYEGDAIPELDALLEAAGIASRPNLVEVYQAYRELTKLAPGQVWQHYDWGVGVITDLDLAAQKVTLLFPNDVSKVMTVDGVRNFLKFIEPTHIIARRVKEPETLRKLADTDPAALVREALECQPDSQIKQSDLKVLFTDNFFSPEEWNSWWSKAREALKLDSLIDFDTTGGARALIRLRDKPRTFEQEIEEVFFSGDATLSVKSELIRQLSKRNENLPAPLVERMSKRLSDDWKLADTPAQRLEITYMLDDLASATSAKVHTEDDAPILAEMLDYTALCEIDNVEYGIRALTKLLERDGDDGCRQAAELLPKAPIKLAQAIWKSLDQEHHIDLALAALQRLLERSLENPETYVWAVRAIIERTWEHVAEFFPIGGIVTDLLDELERWQKLATEKRGETAAAAKTVLTRVRGLLQADKFDAISRAVLELTRDGANRLRRQIQINTALPEAFKSQAERYILLTRKDLEDVSATSNVSSAEDLHLCTARSYGEKTAELRDIASVQIPQNSRVIEEARMEGDLKENAGYQYAKEKQKMLLQQQASLTDQLQRAKVVHHSEVDATRVGFGTRFVATNGTTGKAETYTLLGRWETNAERNILSIQAPLAAQFVGKVQGDAVVIQHPGGGSTPFVIEKIENALQDAEWSADQA